SRLSRRGESDPRQSRQRAVRGPPRRTDRAAGSRARSGGRVSRSRGAWGNVAGSRGLRLYGTVNLRDEELERYARHIVLPQVRGAGQRNLKAASVAVAGGAGRVRSP